MSREPFKIDINDLAFFIHQAALDPHLSLDSLNEICDACIHFNFSGLCTNLIRIPAARKRLGNNKNTKLIAVIGFPFGDIPNEHKRLQAEWAAEQGAEELDVVPNYLALHENKTDIFAEELAEICSIGLPVRAILDTQNFGKEKLALAIEASIDSGVRGIQSGNGFGPTINKSVIDDLHSLIKGRCSIKAVGRIKSLTLAIELIEAGSSEIGTSLGPQLLKEFKRNQK